MLKDVQILSSNKILNTVMLAYYQVHETKLKSGQLIIVGKNTFAVYLMPYSSECVFDEQFKLYAKPLKYFKKIVG